jgi:hypothetical protein
MREEGRVSRCSMNKTWKELHTLLEAGFQSRYAFEWGAYPMRMQGTERCRTLGLFVIISVKAWHPISCR